MNEKIIAGALSLAVICGAFFAGKHYENMVWNEKWQADQIDRQNQQIKDRAAIDAKQKQWQSDKNQIQQDAQIEIKKYQDNAAAARRDADRMLESYRKLRQQSAGGNPATGTGKSTTGKTGDLQSDMFAESVSRNIELAKYADNLRVNLQSCNRQYLSLDTKKAP